MIAHLARLTEYTSTDVIGKPSASTKLLSMSILFYKLINFRNFIHFSVTNLGSIMYCIFLIIKIRNEIRQTAVFWLRKEEELAKIEENKVERKIS